jgi:hypothetical protein
MITKRKILILPIVVAIVIGILILIGRESTPNGRYLNSENGYWMDFRESGNVTVHHDPNNSPQVYSWSLSKKGDLQERFEGMRLGAIQNAKSDVEEAQKILETMQPDDNRITTVNGWIKEGTETLNDALSKNEREWVFGDKYKDIDKFIVIWGNRGDILVVLVQDGDTIKNPKGKALFRKVK